MIKLSRKAGLSREEGDKARGHKLHIVLLYRDTHVERTQVKHSAHVSIHEENLQYIMSWEHQASFFNTAHVTPLHYTCTIAVLCDNATDLIRTYCPTVGASYFTPTFNITALTFNTLGAHTHTMACSVRHQPGLVE